MKINHNEYQAHLESISYYLLEEKSWWQETDIGVMYFDVQNELGDELRKSSINLHHFRLSTLKKEVLDKKEVITQK